MGEPPIARIFAGGNGGMGEPPIAVIPAGGSGGIGEPPIDATLCLSETPVNTTRTAKANDKT